jgi:predicted AlkP superfamily phosphohydrolase/phosphomutase
VKRLFAVKHVFDPRGPLPEEMVQNQYWKKDGATYKFWKYWDPNHPLHDPDQADTLGDVLPHIYRELDAAVGELLERLADENTTLFIISDHGFGPMEKAVYLNRWLAQKGYLHFKEDGALTPRQRAAGMMRAGLRRGVKWLDNPLVNRAKRRAFALLPGLKGALYSSVAFGQVDWMRTQAYALGTMGNIYLNRQGREPNGIVTGGEEAERLSDRLMAELGQLFDPDTGQPVFHVIHRGSDLYHGPHADAAPDIVCVKDSRYHVVTADWQDGDDIVVALGDKMHFVSDQSGQHDLDGILIAWGRNIRSNTDLPGARLLDLAPTILHSLDQPIPAEIDGRVLTALFDSEWLRQHPPRHTEGEEQAAPPDDSPPPQYDSAEEALVRERLAGLGYLD